jgi:hypothetical protein
MLLLPIAVLGMFVSFFDNTKLILDAVSHAHNHCVVKANVVAIPGFAILLKVVSILYLSNSSTSGESRLDNEKMGTFALSLNHPSSQFSSYK